MKIKDVRKILIQESENFVPDVKNNIFASVGYEQKQKQRYRFGLKPVVAFMTLLLLSLSIIIQPGIVTNSFVVIDINPLIELEVDQESIIVSAVPLNFDGHLLLENLEVEGKHLEEALVTIVDQALLEGYLQSDESEIIVSAINKNQKLETSINDTIVQTLKQLRPDINLNNEVFKDEAKENDVSPGRMHIINKAMDADENLKLEVAKKMDVKDLVAIMDNKTKKEVAEFNKKRDDFDNYFKKELNELKIEEQENKELRDGFGVLIEQKDPREIFTYINQNFADYVANTKEYPIRKEEIFRKREEADFEKYYELVEILLEDIENFYDDYYDFIQEVIEDRHNIEKRNYEKGVKEDYKNNKDFSYDFEKENSYNKYKGGYSEKEKEVARLINQMKAMFRSRYHGVHEEIDKLYKDYEELLEEVSEEYLNSELVEEFETAYAEYLVNKKEPGKSAW